MKAFSDSASAVRASDLTTGPREQHEQFRLVAVPKVYGPRQVIFNEGDPCTGLYLVREGAVKLYHSNRFGRQHALEIAGPGAVLGEFALERKERLSISAETVTRTQLSFLPRERLESFVRHHPASVTLLIDALSRELAKARRKVRDLALKGAESRLAALLLHLADATNGQRSVTRFQLQYGRREIAELIGTSTETAIRLFAKLRDSGIIAVERRELAITDRARLRRIAGEDEAAA